MTGGEEGIDDGQKKKSNYQLAHFPKLSGRRLDSAVINAGVFSPLCSLLIINGGGSVSGKGGFTVREGARLASLPR